MSVDRQVNKRGEIQMSIIKKIKEKIKPDNHNKAPVTADVDSTTADTAENKAITKNCGPMAEQLSKDIEIMGIPVDFIRSPYILPVSYGYSDGHYCAGERAERSNGWIVLFDSLGRQRIQMVYS